jgi:glyoxylase-like metal-dependent hydrolase (beta-lactamase superfamily II)
MRVIDVMHLGRPHVIGCWEVDGALVDPGPESSLATLLAALGEEQPRALLLTHIHLDHAAATGAMVRRWPDLEVYVHERGAPHLIDPSKLLASAERLYGDRLEYLWGTILPVPEDNVRVLSGGETVLGMRVAYTPGHASHHVCYLHEDSGTAFVGDVAACRIPPSKLVMPPTPPPDIDIELWEDSIGIVEGWRPERLALTHFGPVDEPSEHLATVRERIREEAELARRMPAEEYEAGLRRRVTATLHGEGLDDEGTVAELLQAVPTAFQWSGLDRYWRKRAEREAA